MPFHEVLQHHLQTVFMEWCEPYPINELISGISSCAMAEVTHQYAGDFWFHRCLVLWILNFYDGLFLVKVVNLFLGNAERDLILPVAVHKPSVLQAVEQIFD